MSDGEIEESKPSPKDAKTRVLRMKELRRKQEEERVKQQLQRIHDENEAKREFAHKMKQAQYLETGRSHLKVAVEEDEYLETIPEEVPNPENSIGFKN